jgi:hypothetical protein
LALGAGNGPVDFSEPVTGLLPGRSYHACAIAGSADGTRFGSPRPFTTAPAAPAVTTSPPSDVQGAAAVLHGSADPNGDPATGWFRLDTEAPPACDDAFGTRVPGTGGVDLGGAAGPVAYSAAVSGLLPATTYYACAIAANGLGTGNGAVEAFRTGVIAPTVATLAATGVSASGATLEGEATPHGDDATGWFRVGDADPGACDDAFGARVPASGGLPLGAGHGPTPFALALDGLEPNRTYFACAAAANLGGAAFGAPVPFTTEAAPPAVRTDPAQASASGAVTLRGVADPRGAAAEGAFRYASAQPASCADAFGVRVPATGGVALGSGRGEVPFTQEVAGLAPGTWWYCAEATGPGGTGRGEPVSFEVTAPRAPASGGCGCGAGAAGSLAPLWVAALLLLRRRRRATR